ncbi:glycosyltransferase family 2 protein [Candidatus Micrarchaeota archaeon]|nr:glycosyltransferase family 2 protein [Candidatus Micrarchaeota archaeon]
MKISICMGTKNEEKAIATVIRSFRNALKGHDSEFVITDSSSDRTAEIASGLGAIVIKQKPQGYGIALREALMNATGEVIITTDCDGTYPPEAVPAMLKLIGEGYDMVSASRLKGKTRVKNMALLNEFGNRFFAFAVSLLYGCRCTDATTGMRVFRKEVISSIEWTENTGLSLELFFKPAVLGFKVIEMPIGYLPRAGGTKLNPWKGGVEMLVTLMRYKLRPIRKRAGYT